MSIYGQHNIIFLFVLFCVLHLTIRLYNPFKVRSVIGCIKDEISNIIEYFVHLIEITDVFCISYSNQKGS